MPNATSLQKIIDFIDKTQLKEMQKLSTRERYKNNGQ